MRILFLLSVLMLLGPAPAEAGLPFWRRACELAYGRLFPENAARLERLARINEKIAGLRAQFEAIVADEPMGGGKEAEFLRQRLEDLWNTRAKEGEGYRVIPMRAKYAGEQSGYIDGTPGLHVKYLKPAERERYRVHADADGLLRRADGSLLSTCYRKGTGVGYECNTEIFVMDADGAIYSLDGGEFFPDGSLRRHSSVLGGLPLASAGQWQLIDGVPVYMDAKSGHYRPRPEDFRQVLNQFKALKVPTSGYPIEADSYKLARPPFVQ